jgi:transcriptional regulator with XRE-family HTH domain
MLIASAAGGGASPGGGHNLSYGGGKVLVVADRTSLDPVAVRLGEGLRAACNNAGVTFKEVAARLGVRPEQVSTWATGSKQLQMETMERIEQILGVQRGTILRLAGYVDDGKLIDLESLTPGARLAVEAILRAFDSVDSDSSNGT